MVRRLYHLMQEELSDKHISGKRAEIADDAHAVAAARWVCREHREVELTGMTFNTGSPSEADSELTRRGSRRSASGEWRWRRRRSCWRPARRTRWSFIFTTQL